MDRRSQGVGQEPPVSVLDKNWKVYTDPVSDRQPAGADLEFRVKTIEKLQWLCKQSASPEFLVKHGLTGHMLDIRHSVEPGTVIATFRGAQFRIVDGRGLVDSGIFEVDELGTNEAYADLLLKLAWRAEGGWLTDMHTLALAADEDIELLPTRAK